MQTEALPLVNKFHLVEAEESIFPKGAPWIRYHGNYKGLHVDLVWPGKDPVLGVDCVGTVSAALVTYASIQSLKPDLIINAGTAGGFKAKGADIGDVYLASDVAFHDRRIPIPVSVLLCLVVFFFVDLVPFFCSVTLFSSLMCYIIRIQKVIHVLNKTLLVFICLFHNPVRFMVF
jgi:hypothetical protein